MINMNLKVLKKTNLKRINSKVDIGFFNSLDREVLLKATANEFGDGKIPERSFMRSAYDENKLKIIAFIRRLAPSALIGAMPETDFMMKIGRFIKEIIEYKILTAKDWAVPLHVVTIANKGHDRPLIETYEMLTSIDIRANNADNGNT